MHDEVILHVGPTKTGSSSIQYALRHAGSGAGWSYVSPSQPASAIKFYNLAFRESDDGLLPAFMGGAVTPAEARAWLMKRVSASPGPRVILSAEQFSFYAPELRAALLSCVRPCAARVSAIGYLRPAYDRIASGYQQRLKSNDLTLESVLPKGPRAMMRWAEDWDAELGAENVLLRPFVRDRLVEGTVVQDFASALGLGSDLVEPERRNEALGAEAVRLLRQYRRIKPTSGLGDLRITRHLAGVPGPRFSFRHAFLKAAEPVVLATRDWAEARMGWSMPATPPPELPRAVGSEADFDDILPETLDWLAERTGRARAGLTGDMTAIAEAVAALATVPPAWRHGAGGPAERQRVGP